MPTADHPETILYNYLTNPRVSVPRWYLEGSAVFMETWMSGGLGRAQSGYDEMVFRAMVRDDAHFYDPLGLVAEGTAIDFQVGVNAYLYGTRFISYMAYQYSPEQVLAWMQRIEGSERYYSARFEQVFGLPLEDAWQDWIEWEHFFQEANLESVRRVPITPLDYVAERSLGSVSRAYVDPNTNTIVGAARYPGVLAKIARLHRETGMLVDPHTAIGVAAGRACRGDRGVPMVALATADAAKFPDAIERATGVRPALPGRLADLFERPEHCHDLPNDLAAVQALIRQTAGNLRLGKGAA